MSYKNIIFGALLVPSLVLASNAYAGTVSIVAKPIIIDDSALPNVRGLAEVQSLPLFTKMVEVPQERSLEEVSLAELSLVGTSPEGSSSSQTTVSAPVVASYNSPSNTGSLPSSLIHNTFNNTTAPSSGSTTIGNNHNTNTQIIKDLRHEGLSGSEMMSYNPAFENLLINNGNNNYMIANTATNGKIVKVPPPKQILIDY